MVNQMPYIVHVTAVVEGDLNRIEAFIDEYRYNCLKNQPGMEQFYVCRSIQEENVFLYTQIFKDAEAHKTHLEGDDPQQFFEKMAEHGLRFQGQWIAGLEINTPPPGLALN